MVEETSGETSRQLHRGRRAFVEILVFVVYLLVCGFILPQIPADWDELGNRNHGEMGLQMARDYLATGEPAGQIFLNEHGTAFEMLLIGIENLAGGSFENDPVRALRIRHVAIFSVFALSVALFYLLARDVFVSPIAGFLAVSLYALHPRIFHDGFHNASDVGFMAFCVMWIWSLHRLCRRPTPAFVVLHGIACAMAIDIRVVGVYLLGVSLLVVAANWFFTQRGRGSGLRAPVLLLVAILCSTSVFVVLFWPFLWGRPLSNLVWAFSQFARFEIPFQIRYLGEFISSTEVPWHYNLVWFSITTPWYLTAGLLWGVLEAALRLRKRASSLVAGEGVALAVACWVAVPILAPMVLGSTLFNGWRHHFFVFPGLVLISTFGLLAAAGRLNALPTVTKRTVQAGLTTLVLGHLLWALFMLHPYQNLYFSSVSRLFGPQQGTHHRFEVDYWCTSYREGLEFLAANTTGTIYVAGQWKPLWVNSLWLSKEDRERIVVVRDPREADFYLGAFRQTGPDGYPQDFGREVHSIFVGDLQILSIRLLRPPPFGPRAVASALPERPSELRALIPRVWTGGRLP